MSFAYTDNSWGEVCDRLRISPRDKNLIWKVCIEQEGYTERVLRYIATRCDEKLKRFIGDNRFASIYINEVRKHGFKPQN